MTTRAVFSTGSFASVVRMSAKPSAPHRIRDSSTENQPDRGVLAFAARLHAVRIDAGQEIGQSIQKGSSSRKKCFLTPTLGYDGSVPW